MATNYYTLKRHLNHFDPLLFKMEATVDYHFYGQNTMKLILSINNETIPLMVIYRLNVFEMQDGNDGGS